MTSYEPIPLARPALGSAELAAVDRVLRSGRLVLGPEVARFEARLAARLGRRHAIGVTSGTAALELSLWALGLGSGDEVAISAFGFPAASNAVRARGGRAVPVELERATWNLDPGALAAALSPRSRAIIAIDQLGLPTEVAPLEALAERNGLALIVDAACSLGGRDAGGAPAGGRGLLATLSFHPRKMITTGEGGAILTDDDDLAARLRELRNHGQAAPGQFVRIGTNARMPEIAAAIGCVQLERLDGFVAERRLLADGYRERLASLVRAGRISWQMPPAGAVHAYQTFAITLPSGGERDRLRALLAERAIESGPATYAFHRIGSAPPDAPHLPVADHLHDASLALPLYVGMRSGELDRVADALREAM